MGNGPFQITGGSYFFHGTFTWQVSVSAEGRVLQPGTMTWFGDVGSGTELLATGIVRKIGFDRVTCIEEPGPFETIDRPYCDWDEAQALIRTTFLHPILSDLGRNIVTLASVQRLYGPDPLFLESFECGPAPRACNYYSDNAIIGVDVPEPNPTLLLSLGLLALSAARVRRWLKC